VADADLEHRGHVREERAEVLQIQIVAGVHADAELTRLLRGAHESDEPRLATNERGRVGFGVELDAIGTERVGARHRIDIGIDEHARTAPQVSQPSNHGLEPSPVLREIPAVIARRLRRLVGHERALRRPNALHVLEQAMERIAFDVEFDLCVQPQQRREVVDVARPNVPLVGSRVHRDAVSARANADLRAAHDARDPDAPRVPQRRDLVEIDRELRHSTSMERVMSFTVRAAPVSSPTAKTRSLMRGSRTT